MKPHLPLKLRSALLAALVAVTSAAYSHASAEEETSAGNKVYENSTWTQRIKSDIDIVSYAEVKITQQKVHDGGAVGNYNVGFRDNGIITFSGNKATSNYASNSTVRGGAVYSSKNVEFDGNEKIIFTDNSASLTFGNSNGRVYAYGGAVYNAGIFAIKNCSDSIKFSGNSARASLAYSYSEAVAKGGAVYNCGDSESATITLSGNGSITFANNYASAGAYNSRTACGGAIYNDNASFTLENNDDIVFSGNKTSTPTSSSSGTVNCGGGIYNTNAEFYLVNNGCVSFIKNLSDVGGGIYNTGNSVLTITDNTGAFFSENQSISSAGGAICNINSTLLLANNSGAIFSKNEAIQGGAIYNAASDNSVATLTVEEKSSVVFSENISSSGGGAISNGKNATMVLRADGGVSFYENHAGVAGGAITNYGCLLFEGNGNVIFSNNYADLNSMARGGAILNANEGTLSIINNGNVIFEKNYVKSGDSYHLNSLYSTGTMFLAANEDTSIIFKDSVYSSGVCSVNSYISADGTKVRTTGDIVLTGESTVADLEELIGAAPTQEQIQESRTSTFTQRLEVGGGRLVIRDGAILNAVEGLYVPRTVEGTTLMLNQGTVEANVSISNMSTLALSRANHMTGILTMHHGSILNLSLWGGLVDEPILTLSGTLVQEGEIWVNVTIDGLSEESNRYALISTTSFDNSFWTSDNVKISGVSFNDLEWENNTLYLNYTGRELPPNTQPATSLTWSNAAGNGVWSSEVVNWVDGGKDYAYTDGLPVYFGDEGAGTVTLVGTLAPGAVVVENSAGADYVFAGEGSMGGAMSLTKKGAGSLALNASNSYAGGTVVEGGSLVAGGAGSFGTGVITLKGGTLDLDSKAVGNAMTATGGTLSGASAYTGALTVNGDVALDGTAKAGSLTMAGGKLSGGSLAGTTVLAQGGAISSKLTGGSSVLANGTVTLSGDNDFTGSVIISSGTLTAGHANALGKGNVTLQGGTLDMGGLAVGTDVLAMGGTLSGASKYAGNLTVMGDATLSGAATADSLMLTNGSLTGGSISAKNITAIKGGIASQVTGETNLTVLGNVALTSANDYTGTTAITGGTLTLGNDSALGGSSVVLTGGTLNLGEKAAANAITATGGTISGASAYTGSLTVNGNVTLGGTTKAGSITLASGSLTGGSIADTAITANGGSISSVISGPSSMTSTGNVTLSGANTYTGGTFITGGTLTVGHASALGTGAVALNGTLDMGGLAVGNTVNIGGGSLATIVNGSAFAGTVNLNGGTLTLADTLGGGLVLNGGLLDLSGMSSASLGTVTTSALTQINVGDITGLTAGTHTLLSLTNGAGIDTDLLQIVGMDSITGWNKALEIKDGNLVLVLSAITSPTDDIILGGGDKVLDDEVTPDHIEIGGDDDSTITGGGSIAGDGTLDKDGEGDLTIDTENPDWSGDININDGTVIAGNDTALGTGDVNLNGGDLDLGGNSISNDINVNTDATINGGGNYQGELTLNDGSTLNGGTINLGQDATVNKGTINNDLTGDGGINKETDGTVTLNGDNSFKGDVNVNDGTLIAGTDTALGTGDVNLNGGDLDLGGNSIGNDINVNTDATINGGGNYQGELTLNNGSTLNGGTINLGQDATVNKGTINNDLTGTGGINKESEGTVTLGGDNSFTGDVNVNAGTLIAGTDTALGTGDVNLNGGALNMGGWNLDNDIIVVQDSELNGAGDYRGTLTLRRGVLTGGSINIAAGKTFVLENGTLSNKLTGEGGVAKVTDGTVALNGNNTFAGGATISAGTLTLGSATALGTGAVTLEGGTLNLGDKAAANAITAKGGTLSGASAYTGALTVNGNVTLGGTTKAGSITLASGSLTGGSIADTAITANGGSISSVISGGSNVNVTGDTSLSGSNTYTGGTVISGGAMLSVEHANALGSGAVTLQNGILDLGGLAVGNTININSGELGTIVNGGNFTGVVNLNGGTLNLTQGLGGSIVLNGGLLDLTGLSTLAVDSTLSTVQLGAVTTSALTQINVGDISGLGEGTHTLLSFADGSGIDTSMLQVAGMDGITGWNKALELQGNDLVLVLSALTNPTDDILLDGTDKVLDGIVTPGKIQVGGEGDSSISGTGGISGTGTLDKTGTGSLTISTENPDWSGDITLGGGTLIAGTDTALGTGDIRLNGGTLNLGGHATGNDIFATGGTLAGAENHNGGLTVDGNVTLAGDTHANGLTMNGGMLTGGRIVDTDITANGGWIISDITGGGSLTNTGDTALFGDNSYTGGTTITSGTLTAGGATALGTGDVTLEGGTLHLGGYGISNDITVQGDSVLDGAGAYTGTLTLKNGTLTGGGINIDSGKTFILEGGALNNNLTGEGGVRKTTAGTATLGGNNSFSGGTVIDAGTLTAGSDKAFGTGDVVVNGGVLDANGKSVSNNILLHDGATLQGASSAKNIILATGAGVNMAGHSINAGQTLTTQGGNSISGGITLNGGTIVMTSPNLTFTDVVTVAGGSVTTLDVSAIASTLDTDGDNTLISFNGGLDNYTDGCLTVTGIDSTLTRTLTFDGANLLLTLTPSATPPPAVVPAYGVDPATLGGNRSTVYKQLVDGNRNAELAGVLDALGKAVDGERDPERLKKLLDGVSGVLYTTQMSAQIDGNRAALAGVREMMGYGKPLRPGADAWRFAAQATSADSLVHGNADAPGYTRRGYGAMVMVESPLGDGAAAGLSLGYEHADVSVDGLDKWKSDDVRFNAYLLMQYGGWRSSTILGFGTHDYDVTRHIGVGALTAESQASGSSVNFMQEVSYVVEMAEAGTLEPFFRVESSYNTIDAISENGTAGNAALLIGKQEAWATTLTLGARYVQDFSLAGLTNTSRLMLEAGVSKSVGAEGDTLSVRFAGDRGHAYRLSPAERDRWGVSLGGSLLFPVDDTQSISIGAKANLRGGSKEFNATASYQLVF